MTIRVGLPVLYDGQPKLPLSGSPAGGKPRVLTLQGNEAFLPAADGGGWVGPNRVFRGAYYPVAGRIYPGTNGILSGRRIPYRQRSPRPTP